MTTAPQRLDLPPLLVERAVATALAEDLGLAGDITTDPIIAGDQNPWRRSSPARRA